MLPSSAMLRGGMKSDRRAGKRTCSTTHRHGWCLYSEGLAWVWEGGNDIQLNLVPKYKSPASGSTPGYILSIVEPLLQDTPEIRTPQHFAAS